MSTSAWDGVVRLGQPIPDDTYNEIVSALRRLKGWEDKIQHSDTLTVRQRNWCRGLHRTVCPICDQGEQLLFCDHWLTAFWAFGIDRN